ncbi:MAG: class I SAM-dependent rRNA methyltransferase [Polyangiaceae bacterium]|nr:class I SAM-dependent rRNA methyltransferase [Polyangiaceae bacterium]
MSKVTLKSGHVQPVWAGHPWIYAQAVARVSGGASPGDEVDVLDERDNFMGRGLYSPGSAIPVRLYTRERDVHLDGAFFAARVQHAIARRARLGLPSDETNAYRVVHAEGDDLPGLVVDRYGESVAVQFGTVGMKRREGMLLDALEHALGPKSIIDRTTTTAAEREGFTPAAGVVRGAAELTELALRELGVDYRIPLELTQKTGFYLDQRPLRERVRQLARGRRVLDTFTYVGSVALAAARGGAAEVLAIDRSALALEVAAENARANGLDALVTFERADAHDALARAGRQGGYDLVVCDPPKLAPSRAAKKRALGAMRRLAAAGAAATKPGGLMVLCSCSAAIGVDELTRAAALGGRDVGVRPIVLERLFQGADHPVPAAFPEGLYLCSLIFEIATR